MNHIDSQKSTISDRSPYEPKPFDIDNPSSEMSKGAALFDLSALRMSSNLREFFSQKGGGFAEFGMSFTGVLSREFLSKLFDTNNFAAGLRGSPGEFPLLLSVSASEGGAGEISDNAMGHFDYLVQGLFFAIDRSMSEVSSSISIQEVALSNGAKAIQSTFLSESDHFFSGRLDVSFEGRSWKIFLTAPVAAIIPALKKSPFSAS